MARPSTESKVLTDFSHQEQEIAGVAINPRGLLPHDLAYYTYMGSLRAPPCTEGIRWYVLKTPMDTIGTMIREAPHTAGAESGATCKEVQSLTGGRRS